MSESNSNYIAKGLDDPVPIFFFDPVDFILILIAFGLGIVIQRLEIGIVLAWGVMKLAKVMRKGAKRGVMNHSLWRIGIISDKNLSRYDPLKTDFIN